MNDHQQSKFKYLYMNITVSYAAILSSMTKRRNCIINDGFLVKLYTEEFKKQNIAIFIPFVILQAILHCTLSVKERGKMWKLHVPQCITLVIPKESIVPMHGLTWFLFKQTFELRHFTEKMFITVVLSYCTDLSTVQRGIY